MPVAVKNQNWVLGIYDPESGTLDPNFPGGVALRMPMSAFTEGYVGVSLRHADMKYDALSLFAHKTDGSLSEVYLSTDGEPLSASPEETADWETVFVDYAQTDTIVNPSAFAAENILVAMSPYYFLESSLGIYITPQQLEQFKNMYPDCVSDAYRNAVGELTAEVGNRFDMAAMLGEADESKKDDTIRWILQVMTAYNIASPSLNYSEPLEMAYKKVAQTIIKLKGGMVSLEEPTAYRNDKFSANAEVITNRYKYRG